MNFALIKSFAALSLALALTGCGTMIQLNDPNKSSQALDRANLLAPRDIMYQTEEKNGVQVSYNLMTDSVNRPSIVRLTLLLKNNRNSPLTLKPKITLQDNGGVIIQPYSYEGYMQEGASMAGTQIPVVPQSNAGSYYSSGSITNTMTGSSYNYSGTTTAVQNPAQSFQQGFAQGAMMGAMAKRRQGETMMKWANAFWLKSSYDLPAGGGTVGALMYPAAPLDLPLKLTIEAAGEVFVFQSKKPD